MPAAASLPPLSQAQQARHHTTAGLTLLLACALLGLPNARAENAASRADDFSVTFLDVGQGDAILGNCPDGSPAFVVDSGDVPARVPKAQGHFREVVEAHFTTNEAIPLVVASHPHSDHIGNLAWLFKSYSIEAYLDNGYPPRKASRTLKLLEEVVKSEEMENGMTRLSIGQVRKGVEICGNSKVVVRAAGPPTSKAGCDKDPNNCSVVMRIDYGQTSFLLVGDAEVEEERELLADPEVKALLDTDILKAGHHGSDTSSSHDFLAAISPKVVVISAGKPNEATNRGYKHPRLSTIDTILSLLPRDGVRGEGHFQAFDKATGKWMLLRSVLPLYVTAEDGDVEIRSDGQTLSVQTTGGRGTEHQSGKEGQP